MNLKRKISFGLRAKIKLAKVLKLDLSSVKTDKGELFFVDADKLDVGVEVFIKDAEGAEIKPEDGEYTFENQIAVVEDGIVTEIKDAAEQTPAGKGKGKGKRKGKDSNLPAGTTDEALSAIVEIVEDAVEELRREVKLVRGELNVAKEALKRAKLANAHDFANPNLRPKGSDDKILSRGNEALRKFGL